MNRVIGFSLGGVWRFKCVGDDPIQAAAVISPRQSLSCARQERPEAWLYRRNFMNACTAAEPEGSAA